MSKVKRSAMLAFLGVEKEGKTTYMRMTKFSQMAKSKNAKEHTQQYVDMDFEETDVVGYAESIAFGFDLHTDNEVHASLAEIFDKEMFGDAAVKSIVVVDRTSSTEAGAATYKARERKYTVVPGDEGGNLDRYDYSGTFKVKSEIVEGTATTADEWQTCTFTPAE